MSSDLEMFRAHARRRATWLPGDPIAPYCKPNPYRVVGGESHPDPWHEGCRNDGCGCECHEPKPEERALWTQLADEIDDYLGGDSLAVDLFGDLTAEPNDEAAAAGGTGA